MVEEEKEINLDTSWIEEFEREEKEYKGYYREDLQSIKVHCIYVNKNNDIDKIKEERIFMRQPNYLSGDQVLTLIKKNSIQDTVKYALLSILKYNITLEPTNLKTFIKYKSQGDIFLTSIKKIDAISFEKTISMFHDLNDLFILFYEADSKKAYPQKMQSNVANKIHEPPKTKKIFLKYSNAKRKTIRKQLKAVSIL
uniref:Uncharacterized protein n=1 Tax=viral metagenome TaxID=1070528 RepID=A0A6C0F2L5_9ZZZZ